MKDLNIFDERSLSEQIENQKKHAWCMDRDIHWEKGIAGDKYFVPLDEKNIAFPGASEEQKIVISQLLGLIINQTISEMESSLPKLKLLAWENKLKKYPINPEMIELGELFFQEEKKHAQSFHKFQEFFCHQNHIDPKDLNKLLPQAINSNFLNAIIWNAQNGGSAFWWLVAAVEEVSINIYKTINQKRSEIDPLFFELHKKHTEEEIRHENYAFLMLELDHLERRGLSERLIKKTDLLIAETVSVPWILTELTKIFRVKVLKNHSPFFQILESCLPLLEKTSATQLIKALIFTTPYISWVVNPIHRRKHLQLAKKTKSLSLVAA
jgi:hypothetical protein